jgi:hypothetical protein
MINVSRAFVSPSHNAALIIGSRPDSLKSFGQIVSRFISPMTYDLAVPASYLSIWCKQILE